MKKFYFALDTVLNYKEQVLENLQAEHARIIAERVECERALRLWSRNSGNVWRSWSRKKRRA